ncbi:hypothetical protein, partial [uncultured Dialister sp.]|uniref:hypothetical protein n=1 Tax=uncultured Dialister sp. TaxID=278064 RepID=UPI0025990B23
MQNHDHSQHFSKIGSFSFPFTPFPFPLPDPFSTFLFLSCRSAIHQRRQKGKQKTHLRRDAFLLLGMILRSASELSQHGACS